jgi:hypothetical protein
MAVRLAYICERCTPPLRIFIAPGQRRPKCPKHGHMDVQPNRPYRGKKT